MKFEHSCFSKNREYKESLQKISSINSHTILSKILFISVLFSMYSITSKFNMGVCLVVLFTITLTTFAAPCGDTIFRKSEDDGTNVKRHPNVPDEPKEGAPTPDGLPPGFVPQYRITFPPPKFIVAGQTKKPTTPGEESEDELVDEHRESITSSGSN